MRPSVHPTDRQNDPGSVPTNFRSKAAFPGEPACRIIIGRQILSSSQDLFSRKRCGNKVRFADLLLLCVEAAARWWRSIH